MKEVLWDVTFRQRVERSEHSAAKQHNEVLESELRNREEDSKFWKEKCRIAEKQISDAL